MRPGVVGHGSGLIRCMGFRACLSVCESEAEPFGCSWFVLVCSREPLVRHGAESVLGGVGSVAGAIVLLQGSHQYPRLRKVFSRELTEPSKGLFPFIRKERSLHERCRRKHAIRFCAFTGGSGIIVAVRRIDRPSLGSV